MKTSDDDENNDGHEQAEAVGRMLADAFIARVERYPAPARRRLLIGCRERLQQNDVIAEVLLNGD